jgi:outer membrane protein TolC
MEAVRTQAQPVNTAALDAGKAIRAARADAEWPTEHWWEALHDSQLNRIVDNALEQQPTLKAAQARTPGRSTGRHHARCHLPRVDASASADRERYSANSTVPPPLAGNYAWKASAAVGQLRPRSVGPQPAGARRGTR